MATPVAGFPAWLAQAQIAEAKLTPAQRAVLQAAFAFQQRCGQDYYSTRLLSHFLLHADTGLKVAQLARLLRLRACESNASSYITGGTITQQPRGVDHERPTSPPSASAGPPADPPGHAP